MRRIQVIRGGCGIRYQDSAGHRRHMLKTSADGPFACDDAQAEGLVRMGVARYVDKEPDAAAEASEATEETEGQEKPAGTGDDAAEDEGEESGTEETSAVIASDSAKTTETGSKSSAAKKTSYAANKAASAVKKSATATKKTTVTVKKTAAKVTTAKKTANTGKTEKGESDEEEKAPVIRTAEPEA